MTMTHGFGGGSQCVYALRRLKNFKLLIVESTMSRSHEWSLA
jgi:hypothetical protein